MKKWIIILAITNVVTLLALSITLTVLIMRDYLGGYDKAVKTDSEKMAEDAKALTNNYYAATNKNESIEKPENTDEEPVVDTPEKKEEPPKPKKVITLEEYKNTDFQDRWCIKIVSNATEAILENMLKDSVFVHVGSVLENYEVIRITSDAVMFQNPAGVIVEFSTNVTPEWAKDDIPLNKLENRTDLGKFIDPETGEPKPESVIKEKNDNLTKKTETIVDEDGNVIVIPEGVDKQKILKELEEKQNKARNDANKTEVNVTTEHHSLTPQMAYKIQENFVEYYNQPVTENCYDADNRKYIGILIVKLPADSMCAQLGFKEGDIITRLNNQEVGTIFDLDNAVEHADFRNGAEIRILRDGKNLILNFTYSLEKMLEYEQKLRDAMKDSGLELDDDDDDKKDD